MKKQKTIKKLDLSKLTVRKMNFEYPQGVPRHWFGNSGLLTHVINSLSLMFPEGERFFIRSVNRFAHYAKDASMKEDIKRFAGQEIQHGKQHDQFNAFLEDHGYEYRTFVSVIEKFALQVLEPFITEHVWEKFGLSATAAAEHFTATWAAHFLENRDVFYDAPREVKDLFLWHAAEEIEHKDVAFDLLHQVDDSYFTRIVGMLTLFPLIPSLIGYIAARFIAQDDEITLRDIVRDLPRLLTDKNSLGYMYWQAFEQYLRPGFHPSDNDHKQLLNEYLNMSQGLEQNGLNI